MAGIDREALIVKIMRAADAGLISVADRDRRIDNVRRSGNDVELQMIEADIDRLTAPTESGGPTAQAHGPSDLLSAVGVGSKVAALGPILLVVVAAMALAMTWTYRSMRSVMEIGGACASGGSYVPVQPCPDGAWMIGPAIPVMILTAMIGSAIAIAVKAPNLLVPMWGGLFGSLGWNFLDFAFQDGHTEVGWLICGVMFWLMALPAVLAVLAVFGGAVLKKPLARVASGSLSWWVAYAVAASGGVWFGNWSWTELA